MAEIVLENSSAVSNIYSVEEVSFLIIFLNICSVLYAAAELNVGAQEAAGNKTLLN